MTLANALVSSFCHSSCDRSSRQYRLVHIVRKQCKDDETGEPDATIVLSETFLVAHSLITPVVRYKIVGSIDTAPKRQTEKIPQRLLTREINSNMRKIKKGVKKLCLFIMKRSY